MRVLLFASAALIVSLLGLAIAPAKAMPTIEQTQELIESFQRIESYLVGHDLKKKDTHGKWNMKNYNDILEATRELVEKIDNRLDRAKVARAQSMLEKLGSASKVCTEESTQLFDDLGYVFYKQEMRFLGEIIKKYRKRNIDLCR